MLPRNLALAGAGYAASSLNSAIRVSDAILTSFVSLDIDLNRLPVGAIGEGQPPPVARQLGAQRPAVDRRAQPGKAEDGRLPHTAGRGGVNAVTGIAPRIAQIGARGQHEVGVGFVGQAHFAGRPGVEAGAK